MVLAGRMLIKTVTIGIVSAAVLILEAASSAKADESSNLPGFDTFAVPLEHPSKPVKVRLAGQETREFATILQTEAKKPINYAGHFILASWGCGASCIQVAAIDSRDGSVIWLPFTVCCWPRGVSSPLGFQANSRLLVVHGSRDEKGGGTYYYVLDSSFHLVKAVAACSFSSATSCRPTIDSGRAARPPLRP